jgi:hypothetical protein
MTPSAQAPYRCGAAQPKPLPMCDSAARQITIHQVVLGTASKGWSERTCTERSARSALEWHPRDCGGWTITPQQAMSAIVGEGEHVQVVHPGAGCIAGRAQVSGRFDRAARRHRRRNRRRLASALADAAPISAQTRQLSFVTCHFRRALRNPASRSSTAGGPSCAECGPGRSRCAGAVARRRAFQPCPAAALDVCHVP